MKHSRLRQRDYDFRTRRWTVAGGDRAAVSFNDPVGDRHAQSGASGLRREEWLENSLPLLRVEARAIVSDADPNRGQIGKLRCRAVNGDLNRFVARRQGIVEDIAKHLDEPKAICLNDEAGSLELLAQLHVPILSLRFEDFPGFPPGLRNAARRAIEDHGSRIVTNLVEKLVQILPGQGGANDDRRAGQRPAGTTPSRSEGGVVSPPGSGEKGEREQKDD